MLNEKQPAPLTARDGYEMGYAAGRASAAKVVEAAEELLGELNKLKVTLSPLTPLWFERALSLHTLIAEWKGGPQ